MANDSLPTIAADPERPRRPRSGRGRSRGGSSGLLFVNAVLVVVVAAVLGGGWVIFEQQQRIVRGEAALVAATNRIGTLEERLRMTDETMASSDTDISATMDDWITEVRKLWDNYFKHRDAIRALENANKALRTEVNSAERSIKGVQGEVSALETAVAGQQDVATRVSQIDLQLQDAITQMRNVVDRANSAYQMASRLEASLAADVAKIKSDIAAIDAHRAQVNSQIAELQRNVNDLRLGAP
ncbi:MAG: hypothetical protein F4029_16475 [Gammaproteobacteria bacterium]|nr:hypothetical protein [Gammaproteobacteria bacterium]MYF27561.1 hypothetical protein [Gammaproteobacteria bacterium]MYK47812.1 hypothetical protein [Gammaproteobacteria bacterium]